MANTRVNCFFDEHIIRILDALRAHNQPNHVKALTRPEMIRIALEELAKKQLK